MIGQRLKLARAASGLSLRELQAAIDNLVTAQAIGKYERNEDMPSSRVLSALAALSTYRRTIYSSPRRWFFTGSSSARRTSRPSGKKHSSRAGAPSAGALPDARRHARSSERGVGPPARSALPDQGRRRRGKCGAGCPTHWGLGIDPIPNLSELLEERGMKILSVDLTDIDGLTAKVRRKDGEPIPVIVIKENAWSERKRFTLAHELGHMLMDVRPGGLEKAANRFAGAFLMPAEACGVKSASIARRSASANCCRLKELFGASFQAIAYRCHDLGIHQRRRLQGMFQAFNEHGWRKPPYRRAWSDSADC